MSPPEGHSGPAPLRYGLEDVPAPGHQLLYALQLVSFALGIVLVTTALVGPGIGLSRRETVDFGCRVLVVTGVATLLQSYWGHGYPIVEGPAALYWALYLFAFSNAPASGAVLSDVEGAMLVAGVVVALFAASGLTRDSAKLFTPILAATTLMLVSLSLAADSMARFAGVSAQHPQGDPAYLAAVAGVVVLGAAITVLGRGLLRTLPILLTALVAYSAAALLGRLDFSIVREAPWFAAPRPLAWGLPTFRLDLAVTFTVV